MKYVKLIISILFGLMFLNAGLNKFFEYMPMEMTEEQMEMFTNFSKITWLMPLVAIAEIVGGVLVFIPKYRALGALILFPVTVGILLHHVVLDPNGLIISIVLMLVNLWLIAQNWSKFKPIFE